MDQFFTLRWTGRALRVLDQTMLPGRVVYRDLETAAQVREAIRSLRVRGAPAIGAAAGFGLYLGVRGFPADDYRGMIRKIGRVRIYLEKSRPTAVNLSWALRLIERKCLAVPGASPRELEALILEEAGNILARDQASCAAIGSHGNQLIPSGAAILTHCNAGALATAGSGTALSVVYSAAAAGKAPTVYASETRPLLQGARLTAWELMSRGVKTVLICDSMSGWVMKTRGVDLVITGADRIAANGDTANKIGTYALAVLARYHRVPFFVAAPASTFDPGVAQGAAIPIEERSPGEVRSFAGRRVAPARVPAFNPAFDVTPGDLVTAFITDRGLIRPPYDHEKMISRLGGTSD